MSINRTDLVFKGFDSWQRATYKNKVNKMFYCNIDVLKIDDISESNEIYYKGKKFEGEPQHPIKLI